MKSLENYKADLAYWEQHNPDNKNKIDAIKAEIYRLVQEQQLKDEQQEREQRFVENVGGLMDKMIQSGLYEKVYGDKPAEGERIYEYEDNRKNFYMAVISLLEEDKEADRQYYEDLLNARDEKVRRLTQQGIENENHLAAELDKVTELNETINALNAEVAECEALLQKANAERDAAIEQLEREKSKHSITLDQFNRLGTVCEEKNERIAKLEADLEEAKRPKASATSDTTKDLIANLKPATKWADKAKSSYEMFLERNKDLQLIEPPAIEPVNGGDSFRTEDTATESADDQLHFAKASETVTEEQFRSGNSNHPEAPMVGTDAGTATGTSNSETMDTAANEDAGFTIEQRVAALEAHVFGYVKVA
ncbi:hypothetical protein [Paenibacillus contaminans]|uniref:Uncharacterized protein n=1 Tax=Paenibacillus contaminans TaxID=450362 RepID=A0A329MQM7_9BACL|nr:hypothetical protein [Paenibacillus contaminans]RAV22215.1 hypothetical protein DQG23_04490 [Paenibacillus contaminans]